MSKLPRDWPVIVYHANCLDGFTAAYAAWLRYREEAYYIPGTYQEPLGFDLEDREVFVLDFSFKRAELIAMLDSPTGPQSVTIVDHHASAIRDLEGLKHPKLDLRFNNLHSGAILAWKFFHGTRKDPPAIFRHVEDRDLWKFEMNGTQEVNSYLMSHVKTFQNWHEVCQIPIAKIKAWGSQILRAHTLECKEWSKKAWMTDFHGWTVPIVNCPSSMASDIGHLLCDGWPFSMSYYQEGDTVNVSMRSEKDHGIDVSKIAAQYGGGGHRNAAGFRIQGVHAKFVAVDKPTKL